MTKAELFLLCATEIIRENSHTANKLLLFVDTFFRYWTLVVKQTSPKKRRRERKKEKARTYCEQLNILVSNKTTYATKWGAKKKQITRSGKPNHVKRRE